MRGREGRKRKEEEGLVWKEKEERESIDQRIGKWMVEEKNGRR